MGISVYQLLIVLAIVVLLFGAKKIPDLAKGMGLGIKNFKKAIKEDEDEETLEIEDDEKEDKPKVTKTSTTKSTAAKKSTKTTKDSE